MTFDLIKLSIFAIFAIPAAIQDFRTYRFSIFWPAAAFTGLFLLYLYYDISLLKPFAGLGISLAIYGLTYFVTTDTLGMGDIIFGAAAGFYSSFPNSSFAIFASALSGIFYYVFLKKKNRPAFAIPFVPFIVSGAILVELITGHIISY